jgi:hypothetical protein
VLALIHWIFGRTRSCGSALFSWEVFDYQVKVYSCYVFVQSFYFFMI